MKRDIDHRPEGNSSSLKSANLGSPVFEESWDAGSPLNWTEFIARWHGAGKGMSATGNTRKRPATGR